MEQRNKIHTSATDLFLGLAQSAKTDEISLVETAPPPVEEKRQVALKEEQKCQKVQRIDDYAKLEMLMFHCRSVGITIEEQAKIYYMEHILVMFPNSVASFKKQYTTN